MVLKIWGLKTCNMMPQPPENSPKHPNFFPKADIVWKF
jgi:hypothetical protein